MPDLKPSDFKMKVTLEDVFYKNALEVEGWEKRDCYPRIMRFLDSRPQDRVCVLYGLRRTGKTTLLRQVGLELIGQRHEKTAYIKVRSGNNMDDLDDDLYVLRQAGYKYVLIDEATLMPDFIDSASLLSDIYAPGGMKIVLSGTDSLGFWMSEGDELYDRTRMIHTTSIPFREHSRLLGTDDIDEYIRYGGTLKPGEIAFDDPDATAEDAPFRDDETTRRYVDTAIARNIQNALDCCKSGRYYSHLRELREHGEFTNAINRLVEDMNHEFLVSVITKDFKSHDFGSASQALRRDRDPERRTRAMSQLDKEAITERLMELLSIRNKPDQKVEVSDVHLLEMKQYLKALDLIVDLPVDVIIPNQQNTVRTIFTQPGMRFCQAQALVHSVMQDVSFKELGEPVRALITEKILDDVRGRMLEDIVLYESLKAARKEESKVFKLRLERAEFDMLIYDREKDCCDVFEVKHSDKAVVEQAKHLLNDELCARIKRSYAPIRHRCVLYRGESGVADNGVVYCNVNDYLRSLGEWRGGENPLVAATSRADAWRLTSLHSTV